MRGATATRHGEGVEGDLQARRARQFVIALLLRMRGKLRAQELGGMLGVSARTIARDCDELDFIGVSVLAERGAAGGFRLAHAVQPDLGRFVVATRLAGGPPADTRSAERDAGPSEIERLQLSVRRLVEQLAEPARAEVEAALAGLELEALPGAMGAAPEVLLTLRRALWGGRRVRLEYPTAGEAHTRDVDPLVLVAREGVWYLAGYCHWRQDVRTFLVTRIIQAQLLDAGAPVAQQAHLVESEPRE